MRECVNAWSNAKRGRLLEAKRQAQTLATSGFISSLFALDRRRVRGTIRPPVATPFYPSRFPGPTGKDCPTTRVASRLLSAGFFFPVQ
jgi:hypothetical protein